VFEWQKAFEVLDALGLRDYLEQAAQIGVGLEVIRLCRGDQAVERSTRLGTLDRIGEEPIGPTQSEGSDGVFHRVGVDGKASIIEITDDLRPLGQQIVEGLSELAGTQRLRVHLRGPGVQALEHSAAWISSVDFR